MIWNFKQLAIGSGLLLILAGCDDEVGPVFGGSNGDGGDQNWAIPQREIFDGGPGKDGIPALEMPSFVPAAEGTFLEDDDLVVGIQIQGEARAYPHILLDWHEIANDVLGGSPLAINYCPLTGTGMAWSRMLNGTETTFGVSGLLYNSNLIPYDRSTDSHWSQILRTGVEGDLNGETAELYQVIETTWGTWKEVAPHTTVANLNTGFPRPYGTYPYGNYMETEDLIFPVNNQSAIKTDAFHAKDRMYGIPYGGGRVRVMNFGLFIGGQTRRVSIGTSDAIVAGHEGKDFMVAFELSSDNDRVFDYVPNALPVVLEDDRGAQYDIFGKVVSGAGTDLTPLPGFVGFWFSWPAFFSEVVVE
ncbi:MAG: DUF3179 domain-containing protein [Bacteroidota bacterium]